MSQRSPSSSPPHPWQLVSQRLENEINELRTQFTEILQLLRNQTHTPPYHEPNTNHRRNQPHPRPPPRPHLEEEMHLSSDSSDTGDHRRRIRRDEDDDRGLKIDIPEFEGGLNSDDFLDWLSEIERVFEFKGYSDEKKCKIAILKFKDYASLWWENLKKKREREGKERVKSWEKLKKLMKRRFLPDNHKQDLYLKLHTLKQGDKSVEEYIREFEKLMMRSDLPEVKEQTIARFLGGLDNNIAHMVELQTYSILKMFVS